jgi:3-methyladenine DNA glycosylase AlkD
MSAHFISKEYSDALGRLLESHKDPVFAAGMIQYMRNKFPFYGISATPRRELFRSFVRENGWPPADQLEEVCRELYSRPERDYHYFAMWLADKNLKKFKTEAVKLFEFLIVSNAWWDTVDFIAANIIGRFFRSHPELIPEVTAGWMDSGNIWLQRTCILFQLKYGKNVDTVLLYSFIDRLKDSGEFFIQKAIGWMLREYSKFNPGEVSRFAESTQLKPLSRKEALRIIRKKGLII